MAISITNNAEGIGEGIVPTTANTGSSGTACSAVAIGPGSSITALAAAASFGSRGYRFMLGAGDSGDTRLRWSLMESDRVVLSVYVRLRSTITATEDLMGIRNSSGSMGMLVFGVDGRIRMWNAAGAGVAGSVSSSVIPTDGTPRLIQMSARKGTSTTDGQLGWAMYDEAGVLLEQWSSSAVNAGTTDFASVFVGRSTGRAGVHTYDIDEMRAGAFTTGWIDPVSSTPIANAGSDQSNIEPGAMVTLDATGSTTAIGTIMGYAWMQTSGNSVVLSNSTSATPSFVAPAMVSSGDLEFELTVTNSAGLTATDIVRVTILRATECVRMSGTWQPRIVGRRSNSNWL